MSGRITAVRELAAFWARIGVLAAPIPEWICLCGARNRLRDNTCRNCGGPKP